jgi:rhodanese-related sulfurtransferase
VATIKIIKASKFDTESLQFPGLYFVKLKEKGVYSMKRLSILLIAIMVLAGCSVMEDKVVSVKKKETAASDYKPEISSENKEAKKQGFKSVTSTEAENLIASGRVVLIDVRSEEGFTEAHIPNAKNIPLKTLEARQPELDEKATYLIVCKAGKTSEIASRQLAESGFKNIYNMSGGMDSWTGDVVN